MQTTPARRLDVIALLDDKPALRLSCGQVGTIVEVLGPGVFEVEFCDREGRTIGMAELRRSDFLVLLHESARAAAHLLRSGANARRLLGAVERARSGEGRAMTMDDLRKESGIDEADD